MIIGFSTTVPYKTITSLGVPPQKIIVEAGENANKPPSRQREQLNKELHVIFHLAIMIRFTPSVPCKTITSLGVPPQQIMVEAGENACNLFAPHNVVLVHIQRATVHLVKEQIELLGVE